MIYDVAIIGGGIVGLASAWRLAAAWPHASILLLEKESTWAAHQTGHNSGVIHSGIYYKPGSLKAKLAVEGNRSMAAFCRVQGVPFEVCGKTIVATTENELPRLDALYERAIENGVTAIRMNPSELSDAEPHVRGYAALSVPSTGITDFRLVSDRLVQLLRDFGADLRADAEVTGIRITPEAAYISSEAGEFGTKLIVNCAGLYSDRITRLAGVDPGVKIVPFRGEYYNLKAERRDLIRNLVYPVPNPDFPFLGVHFTRMIGGEVHAGPNAVLSLKREGYGKRDFRLADAIESLTYRGFHRLAAANWREGLMELNRSFSRKAFVRSLQRLVPEIRADDLLAAPAGVRAQALLPNGNLVDDFLFAVGPRSLHICNAPSPAATASLEIGKVVASRIMEMRP